jgi:hypothetical protein
LAYRSFSQDAQIQEDGESLEEAWEYTALIRFIALVSLIFLASWILSPVAEAVDRHAGYYYPAPKKTEIYRARARVFPKADRATRLEFVNRIVIDSLRKNYAPQYAVFAKGLNAEKMIIVSNVKGQLNTIYRVRALLATMTAVARKSPLFKEFKVEAILTFFDLGKMLGFKQITISDGESFTHQVVLK